jgi:hypothetical protein
VTPIKKPVHRRTVNPYDHRCGRVVVSILPGDVLGFRWERTRTTFLLSVATAMRYAIRLKVEQERRDRKAKKGGKS